MSNVEQTTTRRHLTKLLYCFSWFDLGLQTATKGLFSLGIVLLHFRLFHYTLENSCFKILNQSREYEYIIFRRIKKLSWGCHVVWNVNTCLLSASVSIQNNISLWRKCEWKVVKSRRNISVVFLYLRPGSNVVLHISRIECKWMRATLCFPSLSFASIRFSSSVVRCLTPALNRHCAICTFLAHKHRLINNPQQLTLKLFS